MTTTKVTGTLLRRRVALGFFGVVWVACMVTALRREMKVREIRRVGLEQPDAARGYTAPYRYKGHYYFVPEEMSEAASQWNGVVLMMVPPAVLGMLLTQEKKKPADLTKQPRRGLFPWQRS